MPFSPARTSWHPSTMPLASPRSRSRDRIRQITDRCAFWLTTIPRMTVESRLGHDAKDVRGAGQCHTTVFSWCAFDSRTGRRSTIPLCTRLSACPDGEWPNLLVVVRDTLASRAGPVHQLRRPGRLRSPLRLTS